MKKTIIIPVIVLLYMFISSFPVNTQWEEQYSGTSNFLVSVSLPAHNVIWASGGSGTVLRSNDNGNNWRNVSIPGAGDVWSIYAKDKKTCFATGYSDDWSSDNIWRTIDGGKSWQIVLALPSSNYFINAIAFFNDNEGIAYGDPDYAFPSPNFWTIYKTYDGGLTWSAISNPPEQEGMNFGWKNAIACVGNSVYFGTTMFDADFNFGPDARIYRSTDRGETWDYSITPGVVQVNTIHFVNELTGYGCRAKTTDGGLTWFKMNDPYETISGDINNFILSATGAGNDIWVTGIHRDGPSYYGDPWNNYNTVYHSSDGGVNWVLDYTVPTGTPNEVRISRDISGVRSLFIIQDDGGIAAKRLTPAEYYLSTVEKTSALNNNYPNPFNPVTNISYRINSAEHVTLKIFDITGREVCILVNEMKTAGTYQVTWNAAGLSSGIYYYRLEAGKFSDTKKMILIK